MKSLLISHLINGASFRMKDLLKLFNREMKILFFNTKNILSYSTFFIVVFLLFAFSIGPELKILSSLYVPILFMIILFSLILTSESFITEDYNNGCLKELQFLGFSGELIFLSKISVMLVSIIISNLFLIPLTSIFFGIKFNLMIKITIMFILSSPSLVCLSLLSALFSLQIRKNKFIQFIIVMPFFIPIIIFATSTNLYSINDKNNINYFILFGFFLITLPASIILGKLLIKETNN